MDEPLKELRDMESEAEQRFEMELKRKNDDDADLCQNYPEASCICDECMVLRRNSELSTVVLNDEFGFKTTKRVCSSCRYWYKKTNTEIGGE